MSNSNSTRMSEKGARYGQQLDAALCGGRWSEIGELARKTEKHAPGEATRAFTVVAKCEAQIASVAASAQPSTATSAILADLVPKLNEATSTAVPEYAYAARVCLAEIHFLRDEYEKVLDITPQGGVPQASGRGGAMALGWLEVCEVKALGLRITALAELGRDDEAKALCMEAAARTPGSRTSELRCWTERLLASVCLIMWNRTDTSSLAGLSRSLRCFSSWSDFWQRSPSSTSSIATETTASGHFTHLDTPRRQVWRAYYHLLSAILQQSLLYNPAPPSPDADDLLLTSSDGISDTDYESARRQQRSAFRKVEAAYEGFLLNETQFPKAGQINSEIETFVQSAMRNWSIFAGASWTDGELSGKPNEGKESVTRGVLDIIYRAASKTFHSTPILRYLFQIHVELAEFSLAMAAFDAYVEIINKAKARAEKREGRKDEGEVGVDSNDQVVLTAAEAVRVLCRFGDREQAEKAIEVGKIIQTWLPGDGTDEAMSNGEPTANGTGHSNDPHPANGTPAPILEPATLATAYRAIGVSQAHWARLTYETDARSSLQNLALENLRLAQRHDEESVQTAFALAFLLAEVRDIPAATQVVTDCLATGSSGDEDEANYIAERRRVTIWHLLALCLTAQDEYEQGLRMCDAAFEQFGDPAILFGDDGARYSEDEKGSWRTKGGLVDQMEPFEKENLLQIKITQLAFVELTEGAEAAVDASHELLGLYARLFGNPELIPQTATTANVPPTAASERASRLGGTLRSIAGSIRPRSMRGSMEKDPRRYGGSTLSVQQEQPKDANESVGVPISITVTNEDGVRTKSSQSKHHHLPFRHHHNRSALQSQSATSVSRAKPEDRAGTPVQKTESGAVAESGGVPGQPIARQDTSTNTPASPEQPLKQVEHNAPHDSWPPPPGHESQPPRQDVRLPAPHPNSNLIPDARQPSAKDRQVQTSLMVQIWLFISGLYLRAELLDDAAAAANEASKLVEAYEVDVGSEKAGVSAKRLFEKGWCGGMSVDVLWANVWATKGKLSLARELPFEALANFEQAVAHFPDHAEGIIGLSNLLMDIYEEKLPAEEPRPPLSAQQPSTSHSTVNAAVPSPVPRPPLGSTKSTTPANNAEPKPRTNTIPASNTKLSHHRDLTPAELNRLAARDRAYMLLSTLTRLGNGWDNSEAWFTLARSYECSKEIDKAKQALWWVVELEENEPIRPWSVLGSGGFPMRVS